MSHELRWEEPPRPWEILEKDYRGSPALLRVGSRRVALADVHDFRKEFCSEPNVDGHLMTISLFMLTAAVFVLLALLQLIRMRFLLATAIFAAIGFSGLAELRKLSRIETHRVRISLRSGDGIEFVTTIPAEAEALCAVLASGR